MILDGSISVPVSFVIDRRDVTSTKNGASAVAFQFQLRGQTGSPLAKSLPSLNQSLALAMNPASFRYATTSKTPRKAPLCSNTIQLGDRPAFNAPVHYADTGKIDGSLAFSVVPGNRTFNILEKLRPRACSHLRARCISERCRNRNVSHQANHYLIRSTISYFGFAPLGSQSRRRISRITALQKKTS